MDLSSVRHSDNTDVPGSVYVYLCYCPYVMQSHYHSLAVDFNLTLTNIEMNEDSVFLDSYLHYTEDSLVCAAWQHSQQANDLVTSEQWPHWDPSPRFNSSAHPALLSVRMLTSTCMSSKQGELHPIHCFIYLQSMDVWVCVCDRLLLVVG